MTLWGIPEAKICDPCWWFLIAAMRDNPRPTEVNGPEQFYKVLLPHLAPAGRRGDADHPEAGGSEGSAAAPKVRSRRRPPR